MFVKIHTHKEQVVVAICDEDIIGKTFEEEDLAFHVSVFFYKGDIKTSEEVLKLFGVYHNFNVVGKQITDLALKAGVVDKKNRFYIQGVPHAQFIIL